MKLSDAIKILLPGQRGILFLDGGSAARVRFVKYIENNVMVELHPPVVSGTNPTWVLEPKDFNRLFLEE